MGGWGLVGGGVGEHTKLVISYVGEEQGLDSINSDPRFNFLSLFLSEDDEDVVPNSFL